MTYRLTQIDSAEPRSGDHPVHSSDDLQYMSCDHRSWFVSNGPRPKLDPKYERPSASSMLVQPPENVVAARQAFAFALMSSNAYRDAGKYFAVPGWLLDSRHDSPSGLTIDVWTRGSPDSPDEVATVIRGTDGFNLDDWRANLSIWLEPEQYFEAQEFFKTKILENSRFTKSSLTVAGHSLGGGIAINISLRRSTQDRPIRAFAFNSSPRGFYGPYSDTPTAPRVILSENAEFLSLFRRIWWRKLNSIEERKYNFLDFSNLLYKPLGEHRVYELARALLMLALANEEPAAREAFRANFRMDTIERSLRKSEHPLTEEQLRRELDNCRFHLD